MQDSLPAGGLRLYREGVEPSGSLRKVSGYISILLSRTSPVARVVYAKRPFAGPAQVLDYVGLHSPRSHLQQPPGVDRRRQGPVPLERLPGSQPAEDYEPASRGVHPPLPDPRAARRVPPHPLLRLPRQLPPRAEAGAVPRAAPHASRTGRSARRLSRPIRSPDRDVVAPMPVLLDRHYGGD